MNPLKLILILFGVTTIHITTESCKQIKETKKPPKLKTENQQTDSALIINGQVVNPLLIYAFQPWPADAPTAIGIRLWNHCNRFSIGYSINTTSAELGDGQGKFGYNYIGKTSNNIYVVRTYLEKEIYHKSALLFFSIKPFEDIIQDVDDSVKPFKILNDTLVTLEKFYWLDNSGARIIITGNEVAIDMSQTGRPVIKLSTENDGGFDMRSKDYPPAGITGSAIANDWKQADSLFYFHHHPINPYLVYELTGGDFDESDGPTTLVEDIEAGSSAKQFTHSNKEDAMGFEIKEYDTMHHITLYSSFNYQYLGKTKNGVHVIRTSSSGGGSGSLGLLLFIRFKLGKSFDYNGVIKDQLLMCLERDYVFGAKEYSEVTIKDKSVNIESTSMFSPTDTTHVTLQF